MEVDIYFTDEIGVRSDHYSGTKLTIKGKTPEAKSTGARFGLNTISAVYAQGKFRFLALIVSVGAQVFITFLKRLIHGAKRPVFLIADRYF